MSPGSSGHEVDLRLGIAGHADGVLDYPRCRLVAYFGDLEAVTMQMNRVFVAAVVVQDQTIALASGSREK